MLAAIIVDFLVILPEQICNQLQSVYYVIGSTRYRWATESLIMNQSQVAHLWWLKAEHMHRFVCMRNRCLRFRWAADGTGPSVTCMTHKLAGLFAFNYRRIKCERPSVDANTNGDCDCSCKRVFVYTFGMTRTGKASERYNSRACICVRNAKH